MDLQQRVRPANNLERFAAHFVAHPPALESLWLDLLGTSTIDFEPQLKHFDYYMISIHFLAKYPTELEMEAKFEKSDRTARDWVWKFWLPKIQSLKPMKIQWPIRWGVDENDPNAPQPTFIATVDGVHCPIMNQVTVNGPKIQSVTVTNLVHLVLTMRLQSRFSRTKWCG